MRTWLAAWWQPLLAEMRKSREGAAVPVDRLWALLGIRMEGE